MSCPVVFRETYYEIFKLSVSLSFVIDIQGLPRNPQFSMSNKKIFSDYIYWKLIPHGGKKVIWKPPGLQTIELLFIVWFQNISASMILFDLHDGNPKKWVLDDHSYLKMKNKTEQVLWEVILSRYKPNKGLDLLASSIVFFNTILCSLPSAISDLLMAWIEFFYCLSAPYLFPCTLPISTYKCLEQKLNRFPPLLFWRSAVYHYLLRFDFDGYPLAVTTGLSRVQANYKEDSIVWGKENIFLGVKRPRFQPRNSSHDLGDAGQGVKTVESQLTHLKIGNDAIHLYQRVVVRCRGELWSWNEVRDIK